MSAVLKDVVFIAKGFDSNIHLHAFIYLAQELEIIPRQYSFDYSLNIPFSENLEDEIMYLKTKGYIVEKNDGRKLIVAEEQFKNGLQVINEQQAARLEKIAALNTETIVNMARLLYLIKTNPDLEIEEHENRFRKMARRNFFMNLSTFNESTSRLKDIKAKVGLSEV